MKYENLTRFNDGEFKRLVGVPRPLFLKMVSVLQHAELAKKKIWKTSFVVFRGSIVVNFKLLTLL